MLKWLWRGILALLVLAVAVVGGGFLWLSGSLPQTDGERRVAGLAASVDVIRDRNAIPHIFAESQTDAAFALGFAHAQDRLWQMEMQRRIGAGRLSEVLGEATLDIDRFLRMLGLYRLAEASHGKLDPGTRAVLDAYARGVNAFLQTRSGPLPPEFLILGVEPAPWQPADSIVWIKVMALNLGGHWQRDLMRLRMAMRLSTSQILDFYTPYSRAAPAGVSAGGRFSDLLSPTVLAKVQALMPAKADGLGSNNWVVDGSRTTSGKPLLANDPHLGLGAPAIWYLTHLHWQGRNLIGATLPGVPMVVLGRNDRIAWGFTNGEPDVQDLYIEKLDPDDANRYLTPDGPRPFAVRREVIKVKDGEDVVLQVRQTRHGPVLSDVHAASRSATPDGHVLALSWTALRDDDLTIQAGTDLAVAQGWDDFVAALENFHAPQQNIVYADVDGNVGYIAPGRVPVRHPDNAVRGYMPQPGWRAEYDWQGFIPYDELPRAFNPAGGRIATANHRIADADYPHHLSFDWAAGYRAQRIFDLIDATAKHNRATFRAMQGDNVSPFARQILPHLRAVTPPPGLAADAHALLAGWDGEMDATRPEPLIFNAWTHQFARIVSRDELGELQQAAWGRKGPFLMRVLTQAPAWCDDVGTAQIEDCDTMLLRSLEQAVGWIAERHGEDVGGWRWGDEHVAISQHRPFSQVPVLRELFELRVPVGGSTYTLNVGDFRPFDRARPFASVWGPSLRAIYDLADLDQSLFMHSTGQSGNPLSGHYRSLVQPWAEVRYLQIPGDRAAVEAIADGRLTLVPE